ncbi:hypothetical protein B0F90DRAFT_1396546 [Multifurca ochricompacta]|uniref:Uncharacterized protein n=1 Tax=Multifurca ochricompacta TaxID=376703 RepID=A0AAD4QK51_9AGAM|nr:hypothetical protein B0F90DRAFT_1396546 [Multifurca ochricompacta]
MTERPAVCCLEWDVSITPCCRLSLVCSALSRSPSFSLSLSPSLSPSRILLFCVYSIVTPTCNNIQPIQLHLFCNFSFVRKKEKKAFFFLFACLLVWSLTHARAHVVSREISAPEDQIKPFSCFPPPPSPTLLSPSLSLLVVVIPPLLHATKNVTLSLTFFFLF